MNTTENIALIIPVHNESASIGKLLKNINKSFLSLYSNVDVYVFEDGSTDGTKKF